MAADHSKLHVALCDTLEGWDGWEIGRKLKREGPCANLWLIHVDVWQEPTQHCNAMFLQLKINKTFKKKTNTDGLFGVISPQGTTPAPTMETAGAVGGCWETDFFVFFFSLSIKL